MCPPTIDPHKLVRELAKELRLAEKVTLNNSPAVKPARESNRKIKKKVLDEDFIDISRGNAFLFMGRVKPAKAKKPEKPAKVPKEKPVKPVKEKPVKSPKKEPLKSPKKEPVKSPAKKEKPAKSAKEKPVKAPKEKPVKTPKDKPQKPTKATKQAKVEKGSKPAKTEKNINNDSSQPNAVVSLLSVFFLKLNYFKKQQKFVPTFPYLR